MGISSILLVVLFLQASLGVEWNPDGSCKSSILYSHFTASSDISRPLQHLRDIHHIRHEQQCSGSCITEQGCRVFHYDKEKMVCSLFTDNGPITLDNYYVVNTTQDYRTFLRHADCPYYTECKFDPYCQNDCLDKENFTCECPTNKHGKTCLQDFQHVPELVQTIPVHYGVNGEHMTINGKHYLIIASRSTKSCCWTYDAGLSKAFVYEEVLEKYVHMQNLLPSSTADLQGFVTEGTHYLITTAYEDLPGIAGGSSNAFGNPTDNTLYKFEDTEAIFPEIVAINADQKLTYMVKIGGSWEMHESETCCMMAATVHPSGNLVGITTGRYIQSKPSLDSPWSTNHPHSCCAYDVSAMENGTLITVGGSDTLYYRNGFFDSWHLTSEACCVKKAAVMADGRIIGAGTDNQLKVKQSLNDPWVTIPSSCCIIDVAITPDGTIVGLGTNQNLYLRQKLEFPWVHVPNSCCVTDIGSNAFGHRFDITSSYLDGTISESSHCCTNNPAADCGTENGELFTSYGSTIFWCSGSNDESQYLQVDLDDIYLVSRVAVQGRYNSNQMAKTYQVFYSTDGTHFDCYREDVNSHCMMFSANQNSYAHVPVVQSFNHSVYAKHIRFRFWSWLNHLSAKVGAFGYKPSRFLPHQNLTNAGITGTCSYKRSNGDIVMVLAQEHDAWYNTEVDTYGYVYVWNKEMKMFLSTAALPTPYGGSDCGLFESNNTMHAVLKSDPTDSLVFKLPDAITRPTTMSVIGEDIVATTRKDASPHYYVVNLRHIFPSDGEVFAWQYYAAGAGGPLIFYIFRPLSGTCQFEIVGEYKVNSVRETGYREITLPVNQRMRVKAGDLFGFAWFDTGIMGFPSHDSTMQDVYLPLAASICLASHGGTAPTAGQTVTLSTDSPRYYSMRAIWQPYNDSNSPQALGMESGAIPDSALSASHSHGDCHLTRARLNYFDDTIIGNAWCGLTSGTYWLQIDLQDYYMVTGAASQGRPPTSVWSSPGQWVTQYELHFSTDGTQFSCYKDQQASCRAFTGNSNPTAVVHNDLPKPYLARYVRFYPKAIYGYGSLRVELYGYPTDWSMLTAVPNSQGGKSVDVTEFSGEVFAAVTKTSTMTVSKWNTNTQAFDEIQNLNVGPTAAKPSFFKAGGKLYLTAADENASQVTNPVYVWDGSTWSSHTTLDGHSAKAIIPFQRDRDTFLAVLNYFSDQHSSSHARHYDAYPFIYKWA